MTPFLAAVLTRTLRKNAFPVFSTGRCRFSSEASSQTSPPSNTDPHYDVVICGGGMVGLAAALSLATDHQTSDYLKILLVERGKAPSTSVPHQNQDYGIRTVALNPTTVSFLEQSGAWEHVRRWGVIKQLRVWESTVSDALITFDGAEENNGEIARVVENDEVVRVMKLAVDEANEKNGKNVVEFKYGASLDDVKLPHSVSSPATLVINGSPINANLVIGSDGENL